jgi:hypothetical protein
MSAILHRSAPVCTKTYRSPEMGPLDTRSGRARPALAAAPRTHYVGPETQQPSDPTRAAQAMNTTTLRACRRTGYEGCDPVAPVLRLAKTLDSAGFPRPDPTGSFGVCVETVEKLHSRLRETKGVESSNPFGFRYFRGCGGPLRTWRIRARRRRDRVQFPR